MLKLDGNRTLAHSGGNELDQTVTHVAGYCLRDWHNSSLGLLIALKECYHAFRYLQSILVPGR